ncbi:conserved hypothetical protein [Ricinus communis]|uniref:RNase H type-1 domain-containing protein n=1 Tax=Ricinus communis TaxID=3988 RepID=B9S4K7_RICCO|nr:conserved hypothetical protein [Ricinus communis]
MESNAGFAHKISVCSALEVEVWEALNVLILAWMMGFKKIILEVDSATAIQLCKKGNTTDRNCSSMMAEIHKCLDWDWDVNCVHIYHEANKYADWLTNYAFDLPLGLHFLPKALAAVHVVIAADLAGVSELRSRVA